MKLKPLCLALALSTGLTACASTETNTAFVDSNGAPMTEEQIAKLDRNQYVALLKQDFETVGFEITPISMSIDTVSSGIKEVFERQYDVMEQYRIIAENHRDVQSFLYANQGKSEQELQAAMAAFDAQRPEGEPRLSDRVAAYNEANASIFASNMELTIELATQGVVFSELAANAHEVLLAEGMSMVMRIGDMDDALEEAQTRLELAMKANDVIEQDQAVVKIAQEIQSLRF
ncbi:hypothetical protein KUV89_05800 [Marinobacter hydrocarbonoclasticus]|nr:hypothetical protein [Marinobacter nauticus]